MSGTWPPGRVEPTRWGGAGVRSTRESKPKKREREEGLRGLLGAAYAAVRARLTRPFGSGLCRFGHLAAADAAGADLEGLAGLADDRVNGLEVRLPGALRLVVGVRDVVADATALVTDIASTSHRT